MYTVTSQIGHVNSTLRDTCKVHIMTTYICSNYEVIACYNLKILVWDGLV